jgi:hypothetical protein
MSTFKLVMISAMYENGGNTTHRLLDGHPELFAYPFESQLGTSLVADHLVSCVPFKYRWPEFPQCGSAADDYELIFDEEMKVFLRTPERSKFKAADLRCDEARRKAAFVRACQGQPRSRARAVEAFFRATFEAWDNVHTTGREKAYLGYSPVLVLDADKILADFPDAHVIHVVRNPYSGYADTKKRPFPLGLARYAWTWNLCQHTALTCSERYPRQFHLVRFEDVVSNPKAAMARLCQRLGLSYSETCLYPSWNGRRLEEVYPWGTIRTPTPEANVATMNLLGDDEKARLFAHTAVMQRLLGYEHFWTGAQRAAAWAA